MRNEKQTAKTVDEYIGLQPAEYRKVVKELRTIIRATVPAAEEVISYRIPCYKFFGMLVGFGTHKGGCSFYTMSTTLPSELAKEVKGLKYSVSTIHFNLQEELPVVLIKRVVKIRMKKNEERAFLKKQAKAKK